MKPTLLFSQKNLNTHNLSHFILKTGTFCTGLTVNSIIAIFLLSHDAFATQPPNQPESSTRMETSQPRNSQSSSSSDPTKLGCSTEIQLSKSLDCSVNLGDQILKKIPHSPVPENGKIKIFGL